MTAVTITGGERGAGDWSVAKQDLIGELQVLLEQGQMRIGVMRETQQLVRELLDMKMSAGRTGRVRMGADGYGEHDDLAIALALACWSGKARRRVGEIGTKRLPGI